MASQPAGTSGSRNKKSATSTTPGQVRRKVQPAGTSQSEETRKNDPLTSHARTPLQTSSDGSIDSESQLGRADRSKDSIPTSIDHLSSIHPHDSEDAISKAHTELRASMKEHGITSDKLEASEKDCEELRTQIIRLKEDLSRSERERNTLQKDLINIRGQLTDATDFVFSLNRRGPKMSSSEAADEFNGFCGAVEDWVQRTLGDSLPDILNGTLHINPMTRQFMSYIPIPGKESFKIPDTDECNISATILRFICKEVFEKDFYCQPDSEPWASEFLTSIEKAMRMLEPPRDYITLRTWRSETFTAFTHTPNFAGSRQIETDKLSKRLADMLSTFLPNCKLASLRDSIKTTIIVPALQLAHKIHLSIDEFDFQWSEYSCTIKDSRPPLPQEPRDLECWAFLPNGNKKVKFPLRKGESMTYLLDLSPQLVIREAKTHSPGEPKILKRGRILVIMANDESNTDNNSSQSRKPFTVLGDLYSYFVQRPSAK